MSEPSVRKEFPFKQIGTAIANLYARLQPRRSTPSLSALSPTYVQDEDATQPLPARNAIVALDDLPITNTITRRWPLTKLDYPAFIRPEEPSTTMLPLLQTPLLTKPEQGRPTSQQTEAYPSSLAEDETEEMDALPSDSSGS